MTRLKHFKFFFHFERLRNKLNVVAGIYLTCFVIFLSLGQHMGVRIRCMDRILPFCFEDREHTMIFWEKKLIIWCKKAIDFIL